MPTFDGVIETPLEYFLGTGKIYSFVVFTDSTQTACRDVSGFSTLFMVKRRATDTDAAALISVVGSISGTFAGAPSANTQRVGVTVTAEATDTEIAPGLAFWALKRTNAGLEAVMAFGTIILRRAVQVA